MRGAPRDEQWPVRRHSCSTTSIRFDAGLNQKRADDPVFTSRKPLIKMIKSCLLCHGGGGQACAWEPHGKRHRGPIGCEGVSHGGKCKGVASRWNERGFGFIKCPLRPFLFSGNIVVYSCNTCSQGTDAVVGKSLFCWQTRRWRRGRVLSSAPSPMATAFERVSGTPPITMPPRLAVSWRAALDFLNRSGQLADARLSFSR